MKGLFFILLAAILFCCSCSKTLQMATQKADTKWVLVKWKDNVLPINHKATLNLTGNKMGGKSFCNTYGGSVTINGNALKFSPIISTKMHCQEVAHAESKFIGDLQQLDAGTISGGRLRLMKAGEVMMVFAKPGSPN